MWDLQDVRRAVAIEQEHAKEPLVFRVKGVRQVRGLLRLEVLKKSGRSSGTLDESLEDARAWWPAKDGTPAGAGIVKMANPDDSEIVIRASGNVTIEAGADLWIYPVDFLQALRDAWECADRSRRAMSIVENGAQRVFEHPKAAANLPLRDRQRAALGLTGAEIGLLHGPPGTGKTYTLGVNVARLLAGTQWRVLITATTNSAVDQALIAVDDALDRMGRRDLRNRLARIGSGFDVERFRGRGHLLPSSTSEALEELRLHKAAEPDKKDVGRWITWRDEERGLRAKLRVDVNAVFGEARVIAATVASVFHNLSAFDVVPWDYLIVDEASQLPAATAAMAATLADRTLFAGDPKQLPAVVQSEHPLCKRYMMQTAFEVFEKTAPAERLNEQSRMAPEICDLVSKVFYGGELVVANDKVTDKRWHSERRIGGTATNANVAIRIVKVEAESKWSPKFQGRIRYESAIQCAAAAEQLIARGVAESDVWVLTPYRAQRALLRGILYAQGLKEVAVSTVHRAQGGERRVVLFDPVEAGSKFLNGELGDRLLNVALSRAMAQVIVFLSQGDMTNRRVAQIASLAAAISDPKSRIAELSLTDLLQKHGVGDRALGMVVNIGEVVGQVVAFEKAGNVVVIRCRSTGALRRFKTRMSA
jgi:hypothetical protein